MRASGAGVVAFAGVIAHERYVSIDHADGIRTTYSYLLTIGVVAGQRLAQGDVVGTSGTRLHFGARRFGAYIDPASLFGVVVRRRARLVPVSGPPWTRSRLPWRGLASSVGPPSGWPSESSDSVFHLDLRPPTVAPGTAERVGCRL